MKKLYILGITLLATLALLLSGCTKSTPTDNEPTATTTTPTVTELLNGTGGDENACTIHQLAYHSIEGNLIEYVGQNKMNEFIAAYQDKGEDCNIISFVNYCNLTREDIIKAFGWEDKLDQPADGHAFVNWYDETAPYTCEEFLDAIYGDDEELREFVFSADRVH